MIGNVLVFYAILEDFQLRYTFFFITACHFPSSNSFFTRLSVKRDALIEWMGMKDLVLKKMAGNTKANFDKYYCGIYKDPWIKLDYIEFCFNSMYIKEKVLDK